MGSWGCCWLKWQHKDIWHLNMYTKYVSICIMYVLGSIWENMGNTRTSHRKQVENLKQYTKTKQYLYIYIYITWNITYSSMSSNDRWKPGTPANNLHLVCTPKIIFGAFIVSSVFCPQSAWRAFSPRASLSFLARRTCGKETGRKDVGETYKIWM